MTPPTIKHKRVPLMKVYWCEMSRCVYHQLLPITLQSIFILNYVTHSSLLLFAQILDNEVVVATANGRGHVVLPAFMFLRDHSDDEDEKFSHRSK